MPTHQTTHTKVGANTSSGRPLPKKHVASVRPNTPTDSSRTTNSVTGLPSTTPSPGTASRSSRG